MFLHRPSRKLGKASPSIQRGSLELLFFLGMHLIPLEFGRRWNWERPAAANAAAMDWSQRHGLLHEAVEQQTARTGSAAIKPEGELVEVEVQMLGGDGALMRAQEPALQEGGDLVSVRQKVVGRPPQSVFARMARCV